MENEFSEKKTNGTYIKEYREKNKGKLREQRKKYYDKNKEAISKYIKKWRGENPDKVKKYYERQKERYKNDPEFRKRQQEAYKRWLEKNPRPKKVKESEAKSEDSNVATVASPSSQG
jgi:transcriptional regulator of heat shock response